MEGVDAKGRADTSRNGATNHSAYEGEAVFEVDAKHGGFSNAKVARDDGRNVYLLSIFIMLLKD